MSGGQQYALNIFINFLATIVAVAIGVYVGMACYGRRSK